MLLAALVTAGMMAVHRRIRGDPVPPGQLLERLARRTGGHIGTSSTLAELGLELARLIGPHTAALAACAERARFAPDPAAPTPRPRIQIVRALARDLGTMRAVGVLIAPAATRRVRNRPPWATDRLTDSSASAAASFAALDLPAPPVCNAADVDIGAQRLTSQSADSARSTRGDDDQPDGRGAGSPRSDPKEAADGLWGRRPGSCPSAYLDKRAVSAAKCSTTQASLANRLDATRRQFRRGTELESTYHDSGAGPTVSDSL